MPLTITYQGEARVPVEIEGLTPDAIRGKSLDEVKRWEIFEGNRRVELGQLFEISGDTGDARWEMHGDLSGVHWIGAPMREGEIRIFGNAGRHLGSQMRGGRITVAGHAGDHLGAEMRGGQIRVHGNAADRVGAPHPGSKRGMAGGTILIEGDAGNEIGHSMRRGWITVGGRCGDLPGYNMIAGSIFLFGELGVRPGAGMRRGTIACFAARPTLLPTFRRACRYRPSFLPLMFGELARLGFPFNESARHGDFELFHGDFLALGKGEILLPAD